MRCEACNAENREQARWCGGCGAALTVGAPSRTDGSLGARVGGAAAAIPPTAPEVRPAERAPRRAATRLSEEDRPLAGWLVVMRSPHLTAYQDVPLYRGRNMIGRDTWSESFGDLSVSGQHALITAGPEQTVLTDISRHGTVVNNKAVVTHELRDGDLIKIGKTVLVYVPFVEPRD